MKTPVFIFVFAAMFFFTQIGEAQDMVSTTKVSQKSTVIQTIGTTDITVVYHSPLAKGRKIFGNVVPYDFVVDGKEYPWRAGSNQNTTIEFTHDVKIEGQPLAAGSYGLHIFVMEKKWTFIFSKNYKSWGSFQYDKADDALRVTVKAEDIDFQEWLSYDFVDREPASVGLELRWAEKKAHIKIETDVPANIVKDLMAKEEKTGNDYSILASQTLKIDPSNTAEALKWIEKSIADEATFGNKMTKAHILEKMGKKKEAKALREETIKTAQGFNMYYYGLSLYLLEGQKKEAYKVLKTNVENNPKDWIAHLAMGEYYIKEKNQKKVVEHFKQAFENSPDNWRNYARYLYLSNKIILEP